MGLMDLFKGKKAPAATEDPVCHMQLEPGKAAGSSTHGNATYWFCSAGCKAKFDGDPHTYIGHHEH